MNRWISSRSSSAMPPAPSVDSTAKAALRRVVITLIAFLFVGIGGGGTETATAAESASEVDTHWLPALRVGAGIHVQGLDARVFGNDSLPFLQGPSGTPDDPNTPADEGFDFSTTGAPGDAATTVEFRFDLRLYAPEGLLPLPEPVRPRLFLQVGAELPLDDGFVAARYDENFDNRVTALFGAELEDFCPDVPATEACTYAARVNYDILANWSVGIGADFTLPVLENQFHLVPYVGYFGQAFESDAAFTAKLTQPPASDVTQRIAGATDTEILHGVSAGLGLEVDVYESDLVSLRLFLETRATWILSDRENSFDAVNPTPITNFSSADFMIRPSGFIVTEAAGLEIRWNGN